MARPQSVHRFENLWWGATAAWLVGTLLAWNRVQRTLEAHPRAAPAAAWGQMFTVAVVLGVTVLLWWLAARKASPVGRWLVTAAAAISGLVAASRLISLLVGPRVLHPFSLSAFLIGGVLTLLAAAALFRPDADAWFGLSAPEERA